MKKDRMKIWLPITAGVCAIVMIICALWMFTDILQFNNNGWDSGDSNQLPHESQDTGGKIENNGNEGTDAPTPTSERPNPNNTQSETKTYLNADGAIKILSAWVEVHPFLWGGFVNSYSFSYTECTIGGEEYYSTDISIYWYGCLEVLINRETGELFTYSSPEQEAIKLLDDWYNEDYALYASEYLTGEEAVAICDAWLISYFDSSSYSIVEWDDGLYPGYTLFGEKYYILPVRYHIDGVPEYPQTVLVHVKTGVLSSLFRAISDEGVRITIIELLDNWNVGKYSTYEPILLTSDEARTLYHAWVVEQSSNPDELTHYALDRQVYEKYVIYGEQYYYFRSENESMYWYNVLVHAITGELLYYLSSDGQHPVIVIGPLDEWREGWDS